MTDTYYDDFYVNDEAEDALELKNELLEMAKKLLSRQIKEKIDDLESQVTTLTDKLESYSDFEKLERKYKSEIGRLSREKELARDEGYNECKRKRMDELLDVCHGYAINSLTDYKSKKCDKCDDSRKIHFKSPSGKELTEDCECAKRSIRYTVKETLAVELLFNYNGSDTPSRYYRRHRDVDKTVEYRLDESKTWVYKDFSDFDKIVRGGNPKDYWFYVFESKEDAQKYCDWLNALEDGE